MSSEQTPLLWNGNFARTRGIGDDVHAQFCSLTGCPPSNAPRGYSHNINSKSIYGRAKAGLHSQQNTYYFTAALTNTLLLSQVVLGAALTALGAAKVPYIMVTLFGAANTIIAGLVAYLKSRGQPMRSRMYRDDLERVVDEIENSEVMWLGISQRVNGYGELVDGKDRVTVRDEVARLTRLYDRAVRTNNLNNPDLYAAAGSTDPTGTKPAVPGIGGAVQPPAKPKEPEAATGGQGSSTAPPNSTTTPAQPAKDPDQSPASAPPDNKPVALENDKDQPAAARESDLKAKDKDNDKDKDASPATAPDTTTPAKADAPTDPSSSTSASDDKSKAPPSDNKPDDKKVDSGTGTGTGVTPPAGAIAAPDAQPNTSSATPLSMADVDQSPATRPRVTAGSGTGGADGGGSAGNGVAKKVAGD